MIGALGLLAAWPRLWTTNGVNDTAIFTKPAHSAVDAVREGAAIARAGAGSAAIPGHSPGHGAC